MKVLKYVPILGQFMNGFNGISFTCDLVVLELLMGATSEPIFLSCINDPPSYGDI